MAGLGRRTFAPGEVLTASNVMNYLQDQAVMNFADDGARGSAIGTAVSEGMVSYLADSDVIEVYDGTVWQQVYPVPDSGWGTLTLTAGGWTAVSLQYIKIGKTVYFKGEVYGGVASAVTVVTTLPSIIRPPYRMGFWVADLSGADDAMVRVETNGNMTISRGNGGAGSPGLSFASISYALE